MGTDGRRRPTSVQACTVPQESANKSASAWLESLISPEPEEFGEHTREGAGNLQHPAFDKSQFEQDDKEQAPSDHDSVEMPKSPARGFQASSDHHTTPRTQAAEPSRSSVLNRGSTHDLLPFRQESQDSAYVSAMDNEAQESNVDVDLQAANIRARERVEIMRGRVLQTRRVIGERRQELQFLRERLRDATDKLMRVVRELLAHDDAQKLRSLEPQYQELSEAQDALGPAEYAFDLLETRLNREEEELEEEEMHFYTHNNIRLAPQSDTKLEERLTPLTKPYQPEEVDLPTLDLENQLARDYLAKWSEAGNLKEQLHDLENEQYRLIEELAFRERHHLQLSKEKETFLFEFPKTHTELLKTLEQVEDDLYDLRDCCLEQNLFTESEYVYEPYDALVEEIWESVNDARDRSPLHANYIPHQVDFSNKRDHVNTWLLEWMQESTIETMRLRSLIHYEYSKKGQELVDDDWSGLALDFWDQDSAGASANTEKHSTIDVILGGTGSSLELEDWGFGRAPIVVARSLSPQRDVGLELTHVDRIQAGQGPIRRRKRAQNTRAWSE